MDLPNEWRGRCYEAAAKGVLADRFGGWVLVHGRPLGRGGEAKGRRYGHAWMECGGQVLDRTISDAPIPRDAYYALGEIDPNDSELYRYTQAQLRLVLQKTEHWGPWEGIEFTTMTRGQKQRDRRWRSQKRKKR